MSDQPSKSVSDEVDEQQLELAREAGNAYQRALEYMGESVADTGDVKRVGDYLVGFAQEEAEGLYHHRDDGDLEWVEPTDENCHIEVAVCDATDGRFLPDVPVEVTLTGQDGTTVGPVELPFLWHPGLFHYGANLTLPGDGTYDVAVRAGPAPFPRHDRQNGHRFADPVDVTFESVDISTGQG